MARRERVANTENRMVALNAPSPFSTPVLNLLALDLDPAAVLDELGEEWEWDGGPKGRPAAKRPASKRPKMEEMFTTSVVVRKVKLWE